MIGVAWWLENVLLFAAVVCSVWVAVSLTRYIEEVATEVRELRDRLNHTPGSPPAARLGRHRAAPQPRRFRVTAPGWVRDRLTRIRARWDDVDD